MHKDQQIAEPMITEADTHVFRMVFPLNDQVLSDLHMGDAYAYLPNGGVTLRLSPSQYEYMIDCYAEGDDLFLIDGVFDRPGGMSHRGLVIPLAMEVFEADQSALMTRAASVVDKALAPHSTEEV